MLVVAEAEFADTAAVIAVRLQAVNRVTNERHDTRRLTDGLSVDAELTYERERTFPGGSLGVISLATRLP